jgi:hypothetical protein
MLGSPPRSPRRLQWFHGPSDVLTFSASCSSPSKMSLVSRMRMTRQVVQSTKLDSQHSWLLAQHVVNTTGYASLRIRFACTTSENQPDNFCGLDTVAVLAV